MLALSNYANDVVVDDYDYNDGINDDDDYIYYIKNIQHTNSLVKKGQNF